MKKMSITSQITLIIILVAIISAGFSGFTTLYISKNQFARYIDRGSQIIAEKYTVLIEEYYYKHESLEGLQSIFSNHLPGPGMNGFRRGGPEGERRLLVADSNDLIIADSENILQGQKIGELEKYLAAFPLIVQDERVATLYVFNPLKRGISSLENEFISNISREITSSMLITASIALLLGFFLARRITRPMSNLSSAIHQVAQGNLDVRLEPQGNRELAMLASDFNLMAQKLWEHEQSRNSLVCNIAHELRTPLSILRGQLEAIQSGSLKLSTEISSSLVDELIRLTRLVKDLETVGLAESGALKLNIEVLNVQQLIDAILPLRLTMEEDGIDFQLEIGEGISQFRADLHRLTQILINLLSNAMRHSKDNGVIKLKIKRIENDLLFAIEDNGQGIAEEDLKHIFERFYRTDESRSRQAGGIGLGLAIARSYVEAHGGRIWVESQPNQGTVFYFFLPQE